VGNAWEKGPWREEPVEAKFGIGQGVDNSGL
jgi:hypothetical protein